ncbi:Arylsulfatase [Caulifigura coniformis]|uniref:Arylsulfatase n=1 Tax=Caulifigura coniformis TaxID=2527983 RepID=A0A517S7A2_9PLAN|nr:arylsulfatase [Caulifigura coniformis]QDT52006.1 Arylsulfatase [Caulifigura coniformis]
MNNVAFSHGRRLLALQVVVLIAVVLLPAGPRAARGAERPNIVVILADDLGYGDVQCNNPDRGKIATVQIDRLAASGMRFTDAHSSSGVCSPSRYALLTGRYHWRTRLQRGIVGLWERPLIAPDRLTIAGMLKKEGYQTACIGKWHLGWDWPIESEKLPLFKGVKDRDERATEAQQAAWKETFSKELGGGPTTRGFESYFGTDVPNWPPYCFIENTRTLGIPTEFLPSRLFVANQASMQGPALADWTLEPILPALQDRAVKFIAAASREKRPFFLYMPLTSPHTPLAVNEKWRGSSGLNDYADFVLETDAVVGAVVDAIDAAGQRDNTLIVFTSDNGCAPYIGAAELEKRGHFPSGPLRGYKSDAWEGGHRVPFIVRWPGVAPAGEVCHQLVHHTDVMATIAEALSLSLPPTAGEDSFSLVPLLRGSDVPVRNSAVSHSSQGLAAIRQGDWKLICGKGSGGWGKGKDDQLAQLYNLRDDIGESRNLYSERPEIVASLMSLMADTVNNGRSTPGPVQPNDVNVNWRQFLEK